MARDDGLREAFEYRFSRLDPTGAHIDPPSVALYETLVVKGQDWRAHGLLATRWTVSANGLEWRFELRRGLRFHSGAPCDAHAIVRAFDALRWALVEGDQVWYWDPVDAIAADGADALLVRLHYPYARLPSLLWGTHTAVHNEALRAADPARFGLDVADGTGPYRLLSWSEERVVAERWEDYPSALPPFLSAAGHSPRWIEWVAMRDPGDRLAALEAGEVDVIHAPPLHEVERLVAEGRYTVITFPQQSNAYLALDFRRTELRFHDRRLRHALSLAVDREALVGDVLRGLGRPSYGAVPPGDEHYDPAVDRSGRHDPDRAARMLDELGFPRGADGVRAAGGARLAVRCVCQDDAVLLPLARAVRDQLARVGVVLELDPVVPFAPFYDAVFAGPPASLSKWLWPDPIDAMTGNVATGSIPMDNWQHASVPAVDAAVEAWLRADESELAAAASRFQAVIAHELPYIPLVSFSDVYVHRPGLVGYRPFQANLYPFYQPVRLAPVAG